MSGDRVLPPWGAPISSCCFPPGTSTCPAPSLDDSWVAAVGYAAHHGWHWGRDLVFTYGPLGYLLPNLYEGGAIAPALVFNTFLTLAFALGLLAILPRDAPWWSIVLFVLVAFPAAAMGRAAYTLSAPLSALLYFRRPGDAWHWRALVLAAAAGVFALVYVSSGVLGLAIFFVLDLSRLDPSALAGLRPRVRRGMRALYFAAGQDAGSSASVSAGSDGAHCQGIRARCPSPGINSSSRPM